MEVQPKEGTIVKPITSFHHMWCCPQGSPPQQFQYRTLHQLPIAHPQLPVAHVPINITILVWRHNDERQVGTIWLNQEKSALLQESTQKHPARQTKSSTRIYSLLKSCKYSRPCSHFWMKLIRQCMWWRQANTSYPRRRASWMTLFLVIPGRIVPFNSGVEITLSYITKEMRLLELHLILNECQFSSPSEGPKQVQNEENNWSPTICLIFTYLTSSKFRCLLTTYNTYFSRFKLKPM